MARHIVTVLLLVGVAMAGCQGDPEPAERDPVPKPPEEADVFRKAAALEEAGKYGEALALYRTVPAGESPHGPHGDWIRARYRSGRCQEELGRSVEAREYYAQVLRAPNLQASDGDIPLPGSVDINLRKRAEQAMARVGFDAARFYGSHAVDVRSPLRLVAVKSLERAGDESSLFILEKLLKEKDGALRAAAVRSMERIRRRLAMEKKAGKKGG